MMIELYCDGSCPKPNGPGGWGFVIVIEGRETEGKGGEPSTTNNRMELMAAIKGLEWLEKKGYRGERVKITSDSQYVIQGLNSWCFKWRQAGWRRKDRDGKFIKVANKDLWMTLFSLAHETFRAEFEWVRGHNGHEYNERCDVLAGEATWDQVERQ